MLFYSVLPIFIFNSYFYRMLGPPGVWGSGENGLLFSVILGALVIILGEQVHISWRFREPCQRSKNNNGQYVLKRLSFGGKDCTKELKPECAYFLGQTS